jgi:hypothetical protein
MEKGKNPQKGAVKPGTEQVRSGSHIQKGEAERIQNPKQGEQQKQKQQEQGKQVKK